MKGEVSPGLQRCAGEKTGPPLPSPPLRGHPATPRPSSFGPFSVGFAAQEQATTTTLGGKKMYEREATRRHRLHRGLVGASQERRQQRSQPFL